MTKIRSLLVLVVFSVAACFGPRDFKFEIAVSSPELLEGMAVEVTADGVPARFVRFEEDRVRMLTRRIFEVHGTAEGKRKIMPALKVRALFGCGWRERPLRLTDQWSAQELLAASNRGRPMDIDAKFDQFPGVVAKIWVDNRGGAPGELGLGPIKIPIPGDKAEMSLAVTCETPIPITFDGGPLGKLPALPPQAFMGPTILVDPSGRRCYDLYEVWYKPVYGPFGGGGRSETRRLSGRRLYSTDKRLGFILQKPPESMMVQNGQEPTYGVLEDAKCR